jgi:hypothetical protein
MSPGRRRENSAAAPLVPHANDAPNCLSFYWLFALEIAVLSKIISSPGRANKLTVYIPSILQSVHLLRKGKRTKSFKITPIISQCHRSMFTLCIELCYMKTGYYSAPSSCECSPERNDAFRLYLRSQLHKQLLERLRMTLPKARPYLEEKAVTVRCSTYS